MIHQRPLGSHPIRQLSHRLLLGRAALAPPQAREQRQHLRVRQTVLGLMHDRAREFARAARIDQHHLHVRGVEARVQLPVLALGRLHGHAPHTHLPHPVAQCPPTGAVVGTAAPLGSEQASRRSLLTSAPTVVPSTGCGAAGVSEWFIVLSSECAHGTAGWWFLLLLASWMRFRFRFPHRSDRKPCDGRSGYSTNPCSRSARPDPPPAAKRGTLIKARCGASAAGRQLPPRSSPAPAPGSPSGCPAARNSVVGTRSPSHAGDDSVAECLAPCPLSRRVCTVLATLLDINPHGRPAATPKR